MKVESTKAEIKNVSPNIDNAMLVAGGSDAGVLKRFMIEFFPFAELRKAGFFTKEMKGDYYAQAKRVCDFFGYKSVFEYGAEEKEIRCHLSVGISELKKV